MESLHPVRALPLLIRTPPAVAREGGQAEVIVLVDGPPPSVRGTRSLLGLFTDEPEVIDEAMTYVRLLSQRRSPVV